MDGLQVADLRRLDPTHHLFVAAPRRLHHLGIIQHGQCSAGAIDATLDDANLLEARSATVMEGRLILVDDEAFHPGRGHQRCGGHNQSPAQKLMHKVAISAHRCAPSSVYANISLKAFLVAIEPLPQPLIGRPSACWMVSPTRDTGLPSPATW